MKNLTARIALVSLITAGLFAVPVLSRAQDADTNSAATAAPVAHKHGAPFHGTLDALDTNAMTLTVGSRTFQITSATIITKDGKPAILADGTIGKPVSGYYKPADDGTTLNATTVHYGKAVSATKPKKKKKPASEVTSTNAPVAVPAPGNVPPPPPVMPPPPVAPAPAGTNTPAGP
jgi:hypothetical protein